jgi:hypothetical protein
MSTDAAINLVITDLAIPCFKIIEWQEFEAKNYNEDKICHALAVDFYLRWSDRQVYSRHIRLWPTSFLGLSGEPLPP